MSGQAGNLLNKSIPWYLRVCSVITEIPSNLSILIVSVLVFYKVIDISNRLNDRKRRANLLPWLRRDFTLSELKAYNGTEGRILVAVNFNVYDVTGAPNYFGPNGHYAVFAGTDISRNLINFTSERNEKTQFDDLADLNSGQLETLKQWDQQYKEQYPHVGKLLRDGEPHTNYGDEDGLNTRCVDNK